jgi:DNA-binding PadR family transcriptional regulator
MDEVSALGYALLCALHKEPLTGYDLVRRMHRPIGYYWSARQSQIYPELSRLTAAGLIAADERGGPGPHPTRTHRLTAAGRKALAAWLPQHPVERPDRDELVLKTYALRAGAPTAMAKLYRLEAERREARVDEYRAQRAELAELGADRPEHRDFGSYATVELGIRREEQYAQWCRWLADQIATPTAKGGPRKSGTTIRSR